MSGVDRSEDSSPGGDEGALLAGLRAGDPRSCRELVRRFGPRVLSLARRYLGIDADAADAFQETFIRACGKCDSFEGRSGLAAWVRGIAINQCLVALRKRRVRAEESLEQRSSEFDERGRRLPQLVEPAPGVEDVVHGEQLRRRVLLAVNSLPEPFRLVVLLRDVDGYSTEETARALDCEPGAVKVRLHRARKVLMQRLGPEVRAASGSDVAVAGRAVTSRRA
ncbi:MAG: sigma-70 family RNA polymerase sigma factor [Bryobacteraceae bacterium]|nr:sigma-70 family RNA polymerase sigma factor [Bryobacteraceae bacterium]